MDYECDYGYKRSESGNQCVKEWWNTESANGPLTAHQHDQCDLYGFYTVSQGYRKIPGNKCEGGLDLNPTVYSCSVTGLISLKVIVSLVIIGAILYFGWPLFEAVLIALPIPDPKDVKDKVKNLFKATPGTRQAVKKDQYTKNFNQAPESLGESSDEEDTVKPSSNPQHLRYDSDEDKEGLGDSELINLDGGTTSTRDRTATAADKIPKLKRPPQ